MGIRRNGFLDKLVLITATLFGIGYVPLMPGTASCVAAFFVILLIKSQLWLIVVTVLSCTLAFLLSGRAENILGRKDAKEIVIDDFSGMLISCIFIPHDIRFVIAGFLLFRIFDMLKMPPADRIERCNGALGIVGDDIVAGIYANIALHIVVFLLSLSSL